MIVMKLLLSSLFLIGCAGSPWGISSVLKNRNAGLGAVAGATAIQAVDKIEEKLTPEFKLRKSPIEVCSWPAQGEELMTCRVFPCLQADKELCSKSLTVQEFIDENPVVPTFQPTVKQFNAILNKCNKDPDLCEYEIGKYQEDVLLFEVVKDAW